ncbi:MBL fold metallo-hydrolase [Paenibacillus sedimenti]|uniref:MBL fold metallo-hydrolase n=1 Tax=Paenibacillus sedimenti TaxID=2770274 RepID=A0A926QMC2_9BACL|nr:MBL fold metallo-hydrolase [Paenibacillus sedimenti]MBD0383773.1 MBL fold metallo-hydrolase [Paenibacillus sedimenti]
MNIQKLPWAGIRVQFETTSIVIDPLFHFPSKFGQPHEPMVPLSDLGAIDAVLITHHHGDHFDPEALAMFYGKDIPVHMPSESLEIIGETKLTNVNGVSIGQTIQVGALTATATYSVDGIGDPQIAWIVQGGDKKMIHCGDTLWHGYWWRIAKSYGPFDAVCLPVNGAVLELPGMTPSGQPISLTPEQAASAAVILGAGTWIPIHYGVIHHPPIYRQTPDLFDRLQAAAQDRVNLTLLNTKESITL